MSFRRRFVIDCGICGLLSAVVLLMWGSQVGAYGVWLTFRMLLPF